MKDRPHALRLLVILLGSTAIRTIGIPARPFWYDEAFSVLFIRQLRDLSFGSRDWVTAVTSDVHPPGYYILLSFWGEIFGDTLLSYRWLSLLIGLTSVGLAYLLARSLFDNKNIALAAALIVGLSPFQVHYSQEVRMYGLMTSFMLAATILMRRLFQEKTKWGWIPLGITLAAGMFIHNLAIFYILPLFLSTIVLRRWQVVRLSFLAGILALSLYVPWLGVLSNQISSIQIGYWIKQPGIVDLLQTLLQFITGLPFPAWGLAIYLFCAVFLYSMMGYGVITTIRRLQNSTREILWLTGLWLSNLGGLFLFSFWQPVYVDRALLPASVLVSISLAWLLGAAPIRLRLRATSGVLLFVGMALGLYGYFSYRGFPYAPFEQVNGKLSRELGVDEVIVHTNKISALPALLYDPSLPHRYLSDPDWSRSNTLSQEAQALLGFSAVGEPAIAVAGAAGVWVVVFNQEVEEYLASGEPGHPFLEWMEARYLLQGRWEFDDLLIYHYRE